MQKEKGKGYKLTCPYTGGEFGEVFGGLLDPGSAHCATKLTDLLLFIKKRVGSPPSLAKYGAYIQPWLTEAKTLEDRVRKREQEAFRARKHKRRSILERKSKRL